ncbi:MAG: TolC family protein, partial [Bacteroidetes bacterium]|nr:TolC family protein [Bacteroidota bacterium]
MIDEIKQLILLVVLTTPQVVSAQDSTLMALIQTGIENNLALKQKVLSYDKSMIALNEAKGLFLPEISINARYTLAEGGRIIEFPVGDMLNPVYQTLNQITTQMYEYGLTSEVFPIIRLENEEIPFLREHEQETKASLIQPIFNSNVYYNYKLKQKMTVAEKVTVDAYRTTLIAEISKAYYNYRKSIGLQEILTNTKALLDENLRVSESLLRNDKVTGDAVFRAKAEIAKYEQQKAEADRMENASLAWLNFLLNRPLETPVLLPASQAMLIPASALSECISKASVSREELSQIAVWKDIADTYIKMSKGSMLPTITGVVDYGFQGEEYKFSSDDDYLMASFVLKWTLFKGFTNQAKIKQAGIEKLILNEKEKEARQQIALEVTMAWYDLQTAVKKVESANTEEK